MTKCQLSLGKISARCLLNASALSTLLFCLSFALNGYFNDTGCFSLSFTITKREREREGENKNSKEVKGNDYVRVCDRGRETCEEWIEVNHAFSCLGYCKLLLFALMAIWRMDWDGFGMNGLLWDVTIGVANWETVYLTRVEQVCIIEESSHWKRYSLLIGFLQTPISPHQFEAISLSVCMSLSRMLSCLVSLIIQVNFLLSLSVCASL